jgi:hypothetical protein
MCRKASGKGFVVKVDDRTASRSQYLVVIEGVLIERSTRRVDVARKISYSIKESRYAPVPVSRD